MRKDYYEILQVNRNASKEVIDRVYKMLAKKYHPDLQRQENKELYADIFKEINEAYQVLSDERKRAEYDKKTVTNYVTKQEYERLRQENIMLKNMINQNTRQNTTTASSYYSQQRRRNYGTPQSNNTQQKKMGFFDMLSSYIYEKLILIGIILFLLLILRSCFKRSNFKSISKKDK